MARARRFAAAVTASAREAVSSSRTGPRRRGVGRGLPERDVQDVANVGARPRAVASASRWPAANGSKGDCYDTHLADHRLQRRGSRAGDRHAPRHAHGRCCRSCRPPRRRRDVSNDQAPQRRADHLGPAARQRSTRRPFAPSAARASRSSSSRGSVSCGSSEPARSSRAGRPTCRSAASCSPPPRTCAKRCAT